MVMIPYGSTPGTASGLMWGLPGGQTQLTGREGELYEELRQAESTGQTKVFTAEDAQILGIDMSGDVDDWPDWQVKFTPDSSETGFAVSAISPDNYEYTQTGGIITPGGQSYASSQQYMQSLQTYSTTSQASGSVPGYVQLDSGEWISEFDYYSYQPEYRAKLKSAGVAGFNEYMGTTIQGIADQMFAEATAGYQQLSNGEWVDKAQYDALPAYYQTLLNSYGTEKFQSLMGTWNDIASGAIHVPGPADYVTAGLGAAAAMGGEGASQLAELKAITGSELEAWSQLGEYLYTGLSPVDVHKAMEGVTLPPGVSELQGYQQLQAFEESARLDRFDAVLAAFPSFQPSLAGLSLDEQRPYVQRTLDYFQNMIDTNPDAFLQEMARVARLHDTALESNISMEFYEAIVDYFYPGLSDEEKGWIFGRVPEEGYTTEIPLYDEAGNVTGAQPAVIVPEKGAWGIENRVYVAAEGGGKVLIGTYNFSDSHFTPDISYLLPERGPDTRSFWQKLGGSLEAGLGDWYAQVSSAVDWLGNKTGLSENWQDAMSAYFGGGPTQAIIEGAKPGTFEAAQARFQGARAEGIGWSAIETTISMIPLIAIGAATAGAGAAAGGAIAGGIGLGAFGTEVATTLGATIVGGTTSRVLESVIEGGGAYDEAIAQGFSPEDADRIANEVFTKNVGELSASDYLQFAIAWGGGKLFKWMTPAALQNLSNKGIVKVVMTGGKYSSIALTEAGEEYYQEIIKRQAFGEDISGAVTDIWGNLMNDEELRQVAILGAILGVGMGAAVDVVQAGTTIRETTIANLTPELQQTFNAAKAQAIREGASIQQATSAGLDAVAATPEGAQVVQAVTAAYDMQQKVSGMTAKTPEEAETLLSKARSTVKEVKGIVYRLATSERGAVDMFGPEGEDITTRTRGESVDFGTSETTTTGEPTNAPPAASGEAVQETAPRRTLHEFAKPKTETKAKSQEFAEIAAQQEQAAPLPEPKLSPKEKLTAMRERLTGMAMERGQQAKTMKAGKRRTARSLTRAQTQLSEMEAAYEKAKASGKLTKAQSQERAARIAKQRKTIEKLRGKGEAMQTIASIKNDLSTYVEEHLPKSERGAFVAAIDNIKTEAELGVQLGRVEAVAEQTMAKQVRTRIENLMKRTRLKKLPQGKYPGRQTAEVQGRLDKIRANLHGDRAVAQERMMALITEYNNGVSNLTYEQFAQQMEDLSYQGIDGMTSEELQSVHDNLKALINNGRTLRQKELEAIKTRDAENLKMTVDTLTGGKGPEDIPPTMRQPQRGPQGWRGRLSDLFRGQMNWQNVLDSLSRMDKTSKQYQSRLFQWGWNLVNDAQNAEYRWLKGARQEMRQAQVQIFGTTSSRKLAMMEWQRKNNKVNLGTFTDGKGRTVTLEYTPNQIAKKYQEMKDTTLASTFDSMGWTDEMRTALNNYMEANPQLKAWADWQMQWMQEHWADIDKVFSKIYGVHLPHNPNYSHIERDYTGHEDQMPTPGPEHLQLIEDTYRYASERSGALKSRTGNLLPLKNLDMDQVFGRYVNEMGHFIAWAEPISQLRTVFGNTTVQESINQYHDPDMNFWLKEQIDAFARGGMDKTKTVGIIEALRSNFAVAALSRMSVLVKQPSSLPAYATQMSLKEFTTGVADFANPKTGMAWDKWKEMYRQSAYLQERYDDSAMDRDLRLSHERMTRDKGKPTLLHAALESREWLIRGIGYMDAVSNSAGMWAAYRGALNRGMTPEQAIAEMERATEATQSTSRLSSMTSWQRGGTFMRLMTMFQNNEVKYYNVIADNIRNMRAGRVDKATGIKNIAIAWVVLPVLFQLMSDAFKPREKNLIAAAVLGPLGQMLIVGGFLESLVSIFAGRRYDFSVSSLFDLPNEVLDIVEGVKRLIDADEVTMADILSFLEDFAKTAGGFTGFPTPYLMQAIQAIRHKNWPGLVFSDWALFRDEETPWEKQQKLDAINGLSGHLSEITNQDAMDADPRVQPDYYDMADLRGDLGNKLAGKDPATITEENGYDPRVVSYVQMRQFQAEMDLLQNKPLYELVDPDKNGGYDFEFYNQLWQAWLLCDTPEKVEKFKETWDELWDKAYLGNLTNRQMELLRQYALLTDEEQEAFLEEHPELAVNPREEWLSGNVEANALLALWGYGKPMSYEAYQKMLELAEELDIPDAGMPSMVPEGIAEDYYAYLKMYDEFYVKGEGSPPEAKIFRLEHPELEDYLLDNPVHGEKPLPGNSEVGARIAVEFKDEQAVFITLSKTEQTAYLVENPKFAAAHYKLLGISRGVMEWWLDDYVMYMVATELNGQDKATYLAAHADFADANKNVVGGYALTPEQNSVPMWQIEANPVYKDGNKVYTQIMTDWEKDAFLLANPDFAKLYYMHEAYEKGYSTDWGEAYAEYHMAVDLNAYDKYAWMQEHPDFFEVAYQLDPEVRSWGAGITPDYMREYVDWKELTGDDADKFLVAHPEFGRALFMQEAEAKGCGQVEDYAAYQMLVHQYNARDPEALLYRLEHPLLDEWLLNNTQVAEVSDSAEELKIEVQWRGNFSAYEDLTTSDQERQYLLDNADFATAMYTRDAYDDNVPAELIANYVAYRGLGTQWGSLSDPEAKLYRMDNPAFDAWLTSETNTPPLDPKTKREMLEIDIKWRTEYGELALITAPGLRDEYKRAHEAFTRADYSRDAWYKGYEPEWVDDYADYQWHVNVLGEKRDWYLKNHQAFFNYAKRLEGWAEIDFSKVHEPGTTGGSGGTEKLSYEEQAERLGIASKWVSAYVAYRKALDEGYSRKEYFFKHQDLYRYLLSMGLISEYEFTQGAAVTIAGVPLRVTKD